MLLRGRAPGTDEFWSRPKDSDADLGERAFGTDAQLWERYEYRVKEEARLARIKRPPPADGGGRGEAKFASTVTSSYWANDL